MQDNFLYNDDLASMDWMGVIVDVDDPEKEGRCKVKVWGKFDEIDDDKIPWAYPMGYYQFAGGKGGHGAISIPKKDSIVKVRFFNGNIYSPEYYAVHHFNEKAKEEIKDSYENAHILLFDEDEEVKVVYTKEGGFYVNMKGSSITIHKDNSIVVEHKDSKSMIELKGGDITITSDSKIEATSKSEMNLNSKKITVNGNKVDVGAQPNYSMVIGEDLMTLLDSLATAIDAKIMPTPGVNKALVQAFRQLVLSGTCKVSR